MSRVSLIVFVLTSPMLNLPATYYPGPRSQPGLGRRRSSNQRTIEEFPLVYWLSDQPALDGGDQTFDLVKGVAGVETDPDPLASHRH
ncbi:hypothetical protein CH063_12307, partial [Colletotrichum higginsianum]